MVELIDCAFAPRRAAQIMRSDMAHLIASESATAEELRNLCVDDEPRGWANVGESIDWPRRAVSWPKAEDRWAASALRLWQAEAGTLKLARHLVFFFCAADASSSEPRLVVR